MAGISGWLWGSRTPLLTQAWREFFVRKDRLRCPPKPVNRYFAVEPRERDIYNEAD
jgi:hypothetical protein